MDGPLHRYIFDKTSLISHDNCRGNFRTSNAVDAALALRCQKCIIIFIILIWGKNESVGQMKKIILLFSFLEKKGRSGPLNYSSNWCRLNAKMFFTYAHCSHQLHCMSLSMLVRNAFPDHVPLHYELIIVIIMIFEN